MRIQDVWRILKDVDLEAIRREARQRVDVLVVSDDGDDARLVARALGAEGDPPPEEGAPLHPWLRVVAASGGLPTLEAAPVAAVLVSRAVDLTGAMAALRDHLATHGVPVVTLVVGHWSKAAAVARHGEWGRAAVRTLGDAAEALPPAVLGAVPGELHLPLANQFPAFRPVVAAHLVDRTAKANASFAFTTGLAESVPVLTAPLAIGDMLMLTKNQLVMCYRLVLAHGRDGEPRALVGEIVSVLGGGLLFRQAARQLVGLVPVLGIVPKVAVAYAGTYAIGRSMTLWAAQGREITSSAFRRLSREGLARGRTVARGLADQAREAGRGLTRRGR